MLNTPKVTARVIREVAGTIATNGIQELNKTERGGVSQFGYIRACLTATAYNALRAMDGFSMSHNEFFTAVEAQTIEDLRATKTGDGSTERRYKHDCETCAFLGHYNEYDLYYCSQGGTPTVIARYGDEGPEYTSGMGSDHPALVEARSRYEDA